MTGDRPGVSARRCRHCGREESRLLHTRPVVSCCGELCIAETRECGHCHRRDTHLVGRFTSCVPGEARPGPCRP